MQSLDLEAADVHACPNPIDLTCLFQIYALPGYPHLRDPMYVPQPVPEFATSNVLIPFRRSIDAICSSTLVSPCCVSTTSSTRSARVIASSI